MTNQKLTLRPQGPQIWKSSPVKALIPRIIGFDEMFDVFDKLLEGQQLVTDNYPPRNIYKLDENTWEIQFAVAGFHKEELSVIVDGNELIVKGIKDNSAPETKQALMLGIGFRNFEHRITIPDGASVTPGLELGLLKIIISKPQKEITQKILDII